MPTDPTTTTTQSPTISADVITALDDAVTRTEDALLGVRRIGELFEDGADREIAVLEAGRAGYALLADVGRLMNADPAFAEFVRVQLDPRTAVLHEAVNQIQDITLAPSTEPAPADVARFVADARAADPISRDEAWSREGAQGDYEAWLEREQGAGRLLDTYGDLGEVPSHLQPDSSSDLAAEDEYLAAGTGPLAGDARGTES